MSAAILGILVLVLGGLVVVKPAVDHWDDLYRGNPFQEGTTTQTVERERAGGTTVTTTTTKEESASLAERVLGNSGLIFVRLILLAIAALLVAAAVRRVIDGSYALRTAPAAAIAGSRRSLARAPRGPEDPAPAAPPIRNGSDVVQEPDAASPASSIASLVASRRDALGLSQRELAKRAGVSHTVISRIESGQQTPSAKTLERLVDALS